MSSSPLCTQETAPKSKQVSSQAVLKFDKLSHLCIEVKVKGVPGVEGQSGVHLEM